jgi:glycosyltransferase involved in cell wall biosynthesis
MQKSVTAIVPVFNEEKTVAGVVETLSKNSLISEIICVNDCSTDRSLAILKKFKDRIQLINFKKNKGKGHALAAGIKKAKGEIVIFVDADLTNLSDTHIETLLKPILEDNFRAVLGYPSNGQVPNFTSNLTGERSYYKRDIIPHLKEIAKTRFGVEVFLNNLFRNEETKNVPLKKLRGLYKYEKRDSANAFREYISEAVEIALEIGKREGLLPMDKQIINTLTKITDLNELKDRIRKLQNKDLKQFFEKYFLKYIKIIDNHR